MEPLTTLNNPHQRQADLAMIDARFAADWTVEHARDMMYQGGFPVSGDHLTVFNREVK